MVTEISLLIPVLAEFSSFRSIGIPACGDHTLILILLYTEKSIGSVSVIAVPAQTSEPAFFTTLATLAVVLIPVASGLATFEANAPPKSPKP
ncbi:hypothetical protein D9M72_588650 [compost metagenome]